MTGICKLNNKMMRNLRRDPVYQALAVDLCNLGVITKDECVLLIGSGIPKNILLPDGSSGACTEPVVPAKSEEKAEETEETEETEA